MKKFSRGFGKYVAVMVGSLGEQLYSCCSSCFRASGRLTPDWLIGWLGWGWGLGRPGGGAG